MTPQQIKMIKQIEDCLFYEGTHKKNTARFMAFTHRELSSVDEQKMHYESDVPSSHQKEFERDMKRTQEFFKDSKEDLCNSLVTPELYGSSIAINSDPASAQQFFLSFYNAGAKVIMPFEITNLGQVRFDLELESFNNGMKKLIQSNPFACPGLFKLFNINEEELLDQLSPSRHLHTPKD